MSTASRMLSNLPLDQILLVTFFKEDQDTQTMVHCEVLMTARLWTGDEGMHEWPAVLEHLGELPGFRGDWYDAVHATTFDECRTVAFQREIDAG